MISLLLEETDPFAYGQVIEYDNGDVGIESIQPEFVKSPGDRLFTTEKEDNFSDLGWQSYKNSKWWWLVYQANTVDFPFDLENLPGTQLLVPDIDVFKANQV